MCGLASNQEPERSPDERTAFLCAEIEREQETLQRRIGSLVYRICGRLRPDEVAQRVREVLNESAKRALQNAHKFDMGRSATAWLTGIALRFLQEQRRLRATRPVVQSDLGEEAWRSVLDGLCTAAETDATAIRLDIQQALGRLTEAQRRVVELRYFEGLDGEELARALDLPTSGAARVRLARALQCLRKQFGVVEGEVTP